MSDVKPIPDGYSTVTPYLIVRGAAKAIDFYSRAFGATERMRMPGPGDSIGHAEIQVGTSIVMLADEMPEMGFKSPESVGGSSVTLHVYVEDVDAVFARAIAAGAKETRPLSDQFYGDRTGSVEDPFGHQWYIATHVEDVGEEELGRRAAEFSAQ